MVGPLCFPFLTWDCTNKPRKFRDYDYASDSSTENVRDASVVNAWDKTFRGANDHFLLGTRKTPVDLSVLHPDPAQIFRLWQIYLDNVDPLLKVTHHPSLQGRIVEAASNIININTTLEAIMFSIYCISIQSLLPEDCQALFALPKEDLLSRYQFGCQQALSNCNFLQTVDRNCLTALYLYLVRVFLENILLMLTLSTRYRLAVVPIPVHYPRC